MAATLPAKVTLLAVGCVRLLASAPLPRAEALAGGQEGVRGVLLAPTIRGGRRPSLGDVQMTCRHTTAGIRGNMSVKRRPDSVLSSGAVDGRVT